MLNLKGFGEGRRVDLLVPNQVLDLMSKQESKENGVLHVTERLKPGWFRAALPDKP